MKGHKRELKEGSLQKAIKTLLQDTAQVVPN